MLPSRDADYSSEALAVLGYDFVRLIWASPALPGSRHDIAAARQHGILDALEQAGVRAVADIGYQGTGPAVALPQRRRRLDPDTGRYRRLSRNGALFASGLNARLVDDQFIGAPLGEALGEASAPPAKRGPASQPPTSQRC